MVVKMWIPKNSTYPFPVAGVVVAEHCVHIAIIMDLSPHHVKMGITAHHVATDDSHKWNRIPSAERHPCNMTVRLDVENFHGPRGIHSSVKNGPYTFWSVDARLVFTRKNIGCWFSTSNITRPRGSARVTVGDDYGSRPGKLQIRDPFNTMVSFPHADIIHVVVSMLS